MTNNMDSLSLLDLPVELIYRNFDRLDLFNLLVSLRDVCICTRLDQITDTYQPYQVLSLSSSNRSSSPDSHCELFLSLTRVLAEAFH